MATFTENEMVIMINLILFGVVTPDLLDKITETFVCSWFFEGCFSVSVITALYSSRVFFFFRNVVKKPKFSLRMKSPEYVLLYTDELKASPPGKTFLMNPSFDF